MIPKSMSSTPIRDGNRFPAFRIRSCANNFQCTGMHTMLGLRVKTAVATFAMSVLAVPACADAIDGNWCHNDGRRFTIRGSEIVTPGGKHMEGNYSRHWFNYTVPAPEPGAGETVYMTLANEKT